MLSRTSCIGLIPGLRGIAGDLGWFGVLSLVELRCYLAARWEES
jgi:hypothetical protein